jgi:putative ABC transport system permease protein
VLLISTIAIATSSSIAVFALYSVAFKPSSSHEVIVKGDISESYFDTVYPYELIESGALFKLDQSIDVQAFTDSLRLQEPYFPNKARVVSDSLIRSELNDLSESFRENLLSLILVSWVVCLFVILSASELSAVQIRKDTEILELLGGSSRLWYYLLGLEGLLIATVGVILGFTLGFPVTEFLLGNLSETISGQYGIEFNFDKPILGYIFGVLAALFVTILGYTVKVSRRFVLLGFVLISTLLSVFGYFYLAIIIGVVLLLPLCVSNRFHWVPLTVTFAVFKEFISRASVGSRLLLISSALSICLLIGISHFVSSFDKALFKWISTVLHGDIFIQSPKFVNEKDDRVEWVLRNFFVRHRFKGSTVVLNGAEFKKEQSQKSFVMLHGDFNRAKLASGDYALVSEPASRKLGLSVGDQFSVLGRTFTVGGVFRDFSRDIPTFAIEFELLRELTKANHLDTMSIKVKQDPSLLIKELTAQGVDAKSFSSLKRQVEDMFSRTFRVTNVLELVLIIVTALGCALSTVQHISGQSDSLSTFRTIGFSGFMIFRGIVSVIVFWSLYSAMIGGIAGIFLGWVLCEVVNPKTFGWTIPFRFDWYSLVLPCLLVLLANLFASLVAFATKLRPVRSYEH